MARFWLGGYAAGAGGIAAGISTLVAGDVDSESAGGPLSFGGDVAAAPGSPSWISAHPTLEVVYAALEGAGTVQAFRRTGETSFAPLGPAVEAGESVCHVAVAPNGSSLIASCWSDGRVVRMNVDAAGRPSTPTLGASAVDPYAPAASGEPQADAGIDLAQATRALREAAGAEFAHLIPDHDEHIDESAALQTVSTDAQEVAASRPSRTHQAAFVRDGLIATTDMGLDLVRFWRMVDSRLQFVQQVLLPLGSGPRHMVWHPSGHLYVVAELSCEVFALAPDITGKWRLVAGTPLGAGTLPGDTAAELAPSRDGEFLYAGVRGSNTLATIRVRGAGDALAPVAVVDAGVNWPRHHVVARDTLLVAGQFSNDVASLTLDTRTGVPSRIQQRVEAPSPTCVLAAR
ncbi:beta-propeller fold lactonase family protein [Microbacterium sp. NPDC076911]|uniref:lactonase family protein n=1 Tax=Microbacterium sp. NPDC076911 TaxID=3154958 RepID=UPI0034423305